MKLSKVFIISLCALCTVVLVHYPVGAQQTSQKPLENVFTLELSFGDKDVPSEYLLANPQRSAVVNNAGDIYVFDEYKIKVFDKNGKPKAIFGGRGEGPGEFNNFWGLNISPTGFLTITELQSCSIFSPANKFIVKNRYLSSAVFNTLKNEYKFSYGAGLGSISDIVALSDKVFIIAGNNATLDNYNEAEEYYDYLFYADKDIVTVIAKYRNVSTFMYKTGGGGGRMGIGLVGNFRFAVLPDSRILYTHTCHDVKYTSNTAQLTFHIISPEKNMKSEFSFTYKPEAIPDSDIESYEPSTVEKRNNESAKRMNQTPSKMSEEQKKMYNDIVNLLKQKKYLPLFTAMQSDGVYLFLRCRTSDNKMSLIRVINAEIGKEVSNFIQSSNFVIYIIKNGYAYLSTTPKDGYPIVEKYRIDPRVYGK